MMQVPETRAYDRLLDIAAEQMATVSPRPDLVLAAQEAKVPLSQAQQMFASDDALCAAVIQEQMVLLTDALIRRAAAVPTDDVVAQLRELTHAYLDWFFDNPIGGRLLVNSPAMAAASEAEVERFTVGIYNMAQAMMERARDAALIRTDIDIPGVMLTMRALSLGIVLLHDMDHARLWGNPENPRAALTRVMDEYFNLSMRPTQAGRDRSDAA